LRRRASSRLDHCVTPSALGDAVVIETPRWDPTLFKVHFGLVTLKGYTKGEHVLRVRGDRAQHRRRCTPLPGTPTTPSAKPPTTCPSSEASTSLSNPVTAGATTHHLRLLAPWPPCSPCVPRSSPDPGRPAQPTTRTKTRELDRRRPRL
jgi:hypothetical protein